MLSFDPSREPATPKPAATVVVVREPRPGKIEVFFVKRHAASGFMGGALVFPGGKLADADARPEWAKSSTGVSARCLELAPTEPEARAFAIAALRELLEEAAILPLRGTALDDAALLSLRDALNARTKEGRDGAEAFYEACMERSLRLDSGRLEAFARWITPAAEPRRYDTRFYLLPLAEAQSGRHDEHETTQSFWATPEDVLARWAKQEVFLAPPTTRVLDLLCPMTTIDEAKELARAQRLEPICPFVVMDKDRVVLALPGDPLFPEPAPAPSDPRAPTRFVMQDGRFLPERA